MRIRVVEPGDRAEWIRMRMLLWPTSSENEIDHFFVGQRSVDAREVLVADRADGRLGGFVEIGVRPYAEGCETSPVGYVEGWWVDPDLRRAGIGRTLIAAAEDWCRGQGLTEMGSDVELGNTVSVEAHAALGYAEVGRIVCFRKALGAG